MTYSHITYMVNHMKTTLNIDEVTMTRLRREAARRGRSMSELVEAALRKMLAEPKNEAALAPLPRFHSGGARVDVANRDALYEVMER